MFKLLYNFMSKKTVAYSLTLLLLLVGADYGVGSQWVSSIASKVLAINGTATAPSISFISDPTLGFRAGSADQIDFTANGSSQIRLEPNNLSILSNIGTLLFGTGQDAGISRPAAGVIGISRDDTPQELRVYDAVTNAKHTSILGTNLTVGSGTGLTVNQYARIITKVHKVTVTFAALAAAGLTADKTIVTLPAKTRLVDIIADTTTKYIGGGVTAATLIVGKTVGGSEYVVSHDVFTAAVTKGLADADLGTSINRANAVQGGDLPSWTATTAISVRLTTVTANTDQLTQGSTTYYLITEVMP